MSLDISKMQKQNFKIHQPKPNWIVIKSWFIHMKFTLTKLLLIFKRIVWASNFPNMYQFIYKMEPIHELESWFEINVSLCFILFFIWIIAFFYH
jgi:hypothetical protein